MSDIKSAKKGDIVQCSSCSRIVASFSEDCSNYMKISKTQFEQPNKPPLLIPPLAKDNAAYGCPNCETKLVFLSDGFWLLKATVRPIRN
jgi:DNA-directed RNA polymerase subunit RPC12/RpoP